MPLAGARPTWLTFDCYGTLIQWDEGLTNAVEKILAQQPDASVDAKALIEIYDRYEHELEQTPPHRTFREVAGSALALAMSELELNHEASDIEILTSNISAMPAFAEVVKTLAELKRAGFKLCVISNTDDDIIAGNIAQLGGHIDQVISAQRAQAYKPSLKIFQFAHQHLGVSSDDVVHVCASPHLDLAAARDMGFRCVWINRGSGREPLADYTPDCELPTLAALPDTLSKLGWM